jgi:signal transduction histidine kinase
MRPRLSSGQARLLPVVAPVAAAGAIASLAAIWSFATSEPSASNLAGIAALLVASLVAEAFPVPIEGVSVGATSLANVFIVGTAVVYGWAPAVLVALVTITAVEVARRRPAIRVIFNMGLYALASLAAGFAAERGNDGELVALALAAFSASAAFWLVDVVLLAAVVARAARERFLPYAWRYVFWTAIPFAIMASLAVLLVVLWVESPFVALVLIAPMVAIALYQRSVQSSLDSLREVDRLKDEFVAVASHELRTPLAAVYGAAITLRQHDLDPETRDSMLDVIFHESDRLARIVNDVLWASRLESGGLPAVIESCDPAELTEAVVADARRRLPAGSSLELTMTPDLPAVAADPEKLRRVLVNLVDNAIKYSPDGGRIDIELAPSDGRVRFSVRDQGLGIPEAELERIFDKFHRLDPYLHRGVGGTGLGLYICRELVRQMNGRIWVESATGEGSTFSFELPVAE